MCIVSIEELYCLLRKLLLLLQVSAHVHRDDGFHDHALTFLFVAWGQFTDHDITLTAEIDEVLEEDLNCCAGAMALHRPVKHFLPCPELTIYLPPARVCQARM